MAHTHTTANSVGSRSHACEANPLIESFLDGFAQLMCKILDVFFMGAESLSEGIAVDVLSGDVGGDRTTHLLFGRLAIICVDENAIMQLSSAKGSYGRKVCLCCGNAKG